jgi:FAD-dependent urate hydroxylase
MKVLIVGGGIAGVTLANFLEKQKQWQVTITERSSTWRTIGYGIGLHGNGQQVLEELGLYEKFKAFSYPGPDNKVYDIHERLLNVMDFAPLRFRGKPISSFYRERLHMLLIGNLHATDIRFNCSLEKITQSTEGVSVKFANGNVEKFDLVVGADGMHSWIRENAVEQGRLKFYGWKIWLNWVPPGIETPKGAVEFVGHGKMIWFIPTRERCTVGLVTVQLPGTPDPLPSRREMLKKKFGDLPKALPIIENMEDPEKMFATDLTYIKLGRWYNGHVALVGDAMHGISPIPGLGTSLAMEDAYVLATLLREITTAKDIDGALQQFAAKRTPKVARVKRVTGFLEKLLVTETKLGTIARDILLPIVPDRTIVDMSKKLLPDPF